MVITQNFIDKLTTEEATMTKLEYFLNSNLYNKNTVKSNFTNTAISWTEVIYIFDYDARLHFRINDSASSRYNCLFVRTTWDINGKEEIVPSFVVENINNINKLKDKFYDGIECWLFVNLSNYNIRCNFNYSQTYFVKNKNAEIYDRHWHETGTESEAYVIRNVSSIKNYSNIKCLMSRGLKSTPSGWYN